MICVTTRKTPETNKRSVSLRTCTDLFDRNNTKNNVCTCYGTFVLVAWVCVYAIHVLQGVADSNWQGRQKMVDILGHFFDGVHAANYPIGQYDRSFVAVLF